jgi:hypothetical protein
MSSYTHSGRAPSTLVILFLLTAVGGLCPISAQEPSDSLRIELERLSALVESLAGEVERLRSEGDDEGAENSLADLRAAAAAAAVAGGDPTPDQDEGAFMGRQRSLQAMNPEISVNADVMAHLDPNDRDADNFFWREFEISLQSALDPFSRAAVFISRHGSGPEIVPFGEDAHGHEGEEGEDPHGGGGFDIEEGFVEWVSLPGGFGLKFGKFFQRLGTVNRWHAHALPFQSRSLTHMAIVGEEALAQTGVSATWLAPFGGGGAGTYEATVEVTRSGNEQLFGEATSATVLSHINAFWQLSPSTDFELGGSWLKGHYKDETASFGRNVYNAEMAFNWIPPARSRQTGLTVRGGYMVLDGLAAHEEAGIPEGPDDHEEAETAGGLWTTAEFRLSPSWLLGGRFDRVQNPTEPEVTQWLASPTLTWWQSEFVRVRAEYDHLSGIEGGDGSGMFLLQVTFAMGPHKHATY